MGSRVPVQHYNLTSANSFIGTSLHDLNTVDSRPSDIDTIADVDPRQVSLHNHQDSNSVDCIHDSYRNPLPLHGVGVEEDRSNLENTGPSSGAYDILTIEGQDKLNKRKTRDVQYEGDPRFALPLMYVANMYESLVNDVNLRLASLNGIRDKTIGVALEAAGGLYRSLAKKFPKKGSCMYKRRELATSLETRTRFPELVIQEEKRVRFVVVNGLDIVEKPNNVPIDDAEWFKRLTGRNEVVISAQDYKFYSPRHKYRRVTSNSVSNIPGLPAFPGAENSSAMANAHGFRSSQNQQQTSTKHHMQSLSHQPQFHHQGQPAPHYSQNHRHLPEIAHPHESSTISQHMACLQPLTGGHVGEGLNVMPTGPAKFCYECGAPYLRETSKFCSECGVKRLGM
ncbi:uncharacterized protein At2g02148 isoform X2 [Mangifera indica]|uniref:uncharacterized protein At2g02148 isoform X2 n=1 Tax=Mangifera indica TaxID=29780 RepID=UPI001CF95E79|nr:uncharacterized protein At2g02148 isoform X2 [Mangifera indica]